LTGAGPKRYPAVISVPQQQFSADVVELVDTLS
jgi:hypothetical protein